MDHEAIYKAHPEVVTISDDLGAFDINGNKVTLNQSLIDAARVELDKLKYRKDRVYGGSVVYSSYREQLAMIYDDIIAGKLDSTGSFVAHNKAVKDANPKP